MSDLLALVFGALLVGAAIMALGTVMIVVLVIAAIILLSMLLLILWSFLYNMSHSTNKEVTNEKDHSYRDGSIDAAPSRSDGDGDARQAVNLPRHG